MEPIEEVLKGIVHPLVMVVLLLATAAMLTLNQFGYLPKPVEPYLAWVWLVAFVAAAGSVVHFVRFIAKKISEHRENTLNGRTADAFIYGVYQDFDDEEKAVLRQFIDLHAERLGFDTAAPSGELRAATRRLIDRGFLQMDRAQYTLEEYNRHFVVVRPDHYRMLMARPDLIGSKAKRRSFG